jgi:hypothetical protein
MKKTIALLTVFIVLVVGVSAQDSTGFYHMFSVNAATNSIVAVATSQPGLTPTDTFLPCAVRGTAVSDTIVFTNFDSVYYAGMPLAVISLTIDSLYLPSGLTWSTNSANNTFAGSAAGAILVQGTTYDTAGQYKLRIIVSVTVNYGGSPITLNDISAEQYAGLTYKIRVVCPGNSCPTIDNTSADSTRVFIPYICSSVLVATISPAGHDTICPGDSATLTANAGSGYTYLWSNTAHSTTQSIRTGPGSYTVTVYSAGDSAISAPTMVVAGSNPPASITPNGVTTFCHGDSVVLTANAGYLYAWSSGPHTQSITATQDTSYTVTVSNNYGCSASASKVVTVKPLPVVTWVDTDTSFFCSQSVSFLLTPGQPIGGHYTGPFIVGDSVVFNVGQIYSTYDTIFTVTYSYTDTNACSNSVSHQFHYRIFIDCLGIYAVEANQSIRLYPNPNTGTFAMQTSQMQNSIYTISNMMEQVIKQETITSDSQAIDMGAAPAGIYMLSISGLSGSVKFAVMR